MTDEMVDRVDQTGRSDLNLAVRRAVIRLGHAISGSFETLNRIEYSAPWLRHGRTRSH